MAKGKLNKICENCTCECDIPCQALQMLYRIINESDRQIKREMLNGYKKELELIYTEPDLAIEGIAKSIISKFEDLSIINDYNIAVGYVKSYDRKLNAGRIVYADCRKVSDIYKAYLPFDFVITVYEPNISMLSENQKKIVLYHELKHIGIGPRGLRVEPHDIEDFDLIIHKYGLHWDKLNTDVQDILE